MYRRKIFLAFIAGSSCSLSLLLLLSFNSKLSGKFFKDPISHWIKQSPPDLIGDSTVGAEPVQSSASTYVTQARQESIKFQLGQIENSVESLESSVERVRSLLAIADTDDSIRKRLLDNIMKVYKFREAPIGTKKRGFSLNLFISRTMANSVI